MKPALEGRGVTWGLQGPGQGRAGTEECRLRPRGHCADRARASERSLCRLLGARWKPLVSVPFVRLRVRMTGSRHWSLPPRHSSLEEVTYFGPWSQKIINLPGVGPTCLCTWWAHVAAALGDPLRITCSSVFPAGTPAAGRPHSTPAVVPRPPPPPTLPSCGFSRAQGPPPRVSGTSFLGRSLLPQQPQQMASGWPAIPDGARRKRCRGSGCSGLAHACGFAGDAGGGTRRAAGSAGPRLRVPRQADSVGAFWVKATGPSQLLFPLCPAQPTWPRPPGARLAAGASLHHVPAAWKMGGFFCVAVIFFLCC